MINRHQLNADYIFETLHKLTQRNLEHICFYSQEGNKIKYVKNGPAISNAILWLHSIQNNKKVELTYCP